MFQVQFFKRINQFFRINYYLYALGSNLHITKYLDDDVVECLNQAVNDLSINDLDDSVNGAIVRELDEFEASNNPGLIELHD